LGLFTVLVLLHLSAPRVPTDPSYGDRTESSLQPAKEETASVLSHLTFIWMGNLVWRAYRTTLEVSDLYVLNRDQKSGGVAPAFHNGAAASLPLLSRLYRFFKYDLIVQGAWAAIMSLTMFAPAILLRLILGYLESPDTMARSTA
jgi:hypothetical protein